MSRDYPEAKPYPPITVGTTPGRRKDPNGNRDEQGNTIHLLTINQ